MAEELELPGDLSFDEWIAFVFNRDDPYWHWEKDDAPYWNEEQHSALALDHLGRLFADPEILLGRYTPDQIGAGIDFVANPAYSSHASVLLEPGLPLDNRLACIRSISNLYTDLFPQVCLHANFYNSETMLTRADGICYMFWDVFPMYPRTKNSLSRKTTEVKDHWDMHLQIEAACLEVMEVSLQLEHPACQQGALHGLGHWHYGYPSHVESVIDSYLARVDIRPELREYAQQAREGMVQ